MEMTRKEREFLNSLSKEIFGASSKWQKLIEKGTKELLTKKVLEQVPGENGAEPTTREVEVPVLSPSGAHQFYIKRHTLESVISLMHDIKEAREKEQQKQLIKRAQEVAGGSAT